MALQNLNEGGRLSLHACYRSILVPTPLAYTRAGQSERGVPPAPIRTSEWSSRLGGQKRILYTQPRGTPEHERLFVLPFSSLYFFVIHFPVSLNQLWPSCHFDLGGSRHGWGSFREQTDALQIYWHSSDDSLGILLPTYNDGEASGIPCGVDL